MEKNKEQEKNRIIAMIKRQTNYNEEEIIKKLEEYNNNIEKIIREYHGILETKPEKEISTNQKIFKSIRDFMP